MLLAVTEDYDVAEALMDITDMLDVVLATDGIGSSLMDSFPQILEMSLWLQKAMAFTDKLEKNGMADLMM